MSIWINLGLAWVSVILAIMLAVIYVFRIIAKEKKGQLIDRLNKGLRKYHKHLGILLIFTGLVHGLFSSQSVWSFNLGTVAWVVSILLGVNWMMRKYFVKIRGWMFYHRILTVVFAAVVVWHVIDVGGIQIYKLLLEQGTTSAYAGQVQTSTVSGLNSEMKNNKYKDGTYTGEATGFRDGLKVSIVIKSNKITSVVVTEHNEVNARFYATPVEQIPQEIVAEQSTNVDTVSGATFTSVGIINAVNNALSKALISGEVPADQQLPQGKGGHDHGPGGPGGGPDGSGGNHF